MDEKKLQRFLHIPLFNMCGACPVMKLLKEMSKMIPASPEAEAAFKLIKETVKNGCKEEQEPKKEVEQDD